MSPEEDEIDRDTLPSQLCGNLTEEVMDDSSADLDGVLFDVPIKVAKTRKKKRLLNKTPIVKKKFNERYIFETVGDCGI